VFGLPLLLVLASYLIGSIPFSYLVVRAVAGVDIRMHGSGNVGATNVVRNAGKLPGVLALVLDGAKGYAAVTLAGYLISRPGWPLLDPTGSSALHSRAFWLASAGLVAMLGHIFPVWLHFHGGKGVATAAGVFLAIDPRATAAAALIFLIAALATRFVSVGSLAAAVSVPIFLQFLTRAPYWIVLVSVVICLIVVFRHRANIERLATGRERRIGGRRDDQ
jgi:acyl phosphate:glycerol-3-phosphate acyltransferase